VLPLAPHSTHEPTRSLVAVVHAAVYCSWQEETALAPFGLIVAPDPSLSFCFLCLQLSFGELAVHSPPLLISFGELAVHSHSPLPCPLPLLPPIRDEAAAGSYLYEMRQQQAAIYRS
jgi:hypothetical protein